MISSVSFSSSFVVVCVVQKEGGKTEYKSIVELNKCLNILAGALVVLAIIVIVMFVKIGSINTLVSSQPKDGQEITDEQIQQLREKIE